MTYTEIFSVLLTWTPYLVEGFGWNILIGVTSMALGTGVGAVLAFCGTSKSQKCITFSRITTEFSRNIPSVVFQFYLAIMLPSSVPGWIKASLAVAVSVAGFTSDYLQPAILDWRANRHAKALLFVPNWTSYFLIVVIISAAASLIGVNELVSRCNVVINATGNPELLLPIYLYASLFFTAFCYSISVAMRYLRRWMIAKAATNAPTAAPFPSALSPNK
jgi:polar amino acid transport system permease protein